MGNGIWGKREIRYNKGVKNMKIKIDDSNVLIVGEMYSGEVLICDFEIEGVEEDKMYVILNDLSIVEVKE